MKRAVILLLVFVLLLCSGCSVWDDSADVSLIQVHSNQVSVAPYESLLWAQSWTGEGWLAVDAVSLSRQFSQVYQEFPSVTYGDDFEFRCREGVSVQYLSVYDANLDTVHSNASLDALKTLSPGTYYLVINVKVQGYYIPAAENYEYTGYECAYQLIVPK